MRTFFNTSLAFVLFVLFTVPTAILSAQGEGGYDVEGFPGDPPMPTQEEIQQAREEFGSYDFEHALNTEVENVEQECFDYYTFQSVQVQMGLDKDTYAPGETVSIYGDLVNENPYPVVDGNVFVRVSRDNENYMQEGYYVIDEFIAIPNVAIDANNSIEGMYTWTVPQNLPTGNYRFDYFFSVGKKFNLGGLPFSNEVIVGMATFSVEGEVEGTISFDRTNTMVNGESYEHIGNWPEIEPGETVTITQPLSNTTSEDTEVSVTYDLYFWDSLDENDLVNTRTETVTVPANDATILTYNIPNMNESVYYLKITATTGTQQSIVNIRTVSKQERPRLNYPAITKFPLTVGDEFTLFTCFHNTSDVDTEGMVVVTLTDRAGNIVGTTQHEGAIPSAMDFAKSVLTAEEDYEYLTLTAEVYNKEGVVIDSYETVYDCTLLNNCPVKPEPVPTEEPSGIPLAVKYLGALALILIVGFLARYIILSKRKEQAHTLNTPTQNEEHNEGNNANQQ